MKIVTKEILVDCPHCGEKQPVMLNELDHHNLDIITCWRDDNSDDLNGCEKSFVVSVRTKIESDTFKIIGM